MKNLFFTNPFLKYSEKSIFFVGSSLSLAGILLAYYANLRFDGLLDVHQLGSVSLLDVSKDSAINIAVICVLLFVFGKIINPKTRFIDILNAVLVFRIPFYVMCLLIKIPFMESFAQKMAKNSHHIQNLAINPLQIMAVLMLAMLLLVLVGYAIWQLFNGFQTATNCKKRVHYFVFGLLIIVAEAVTKVLIYHV
ncbi:MAG: hypothetical protein QG594_1583 [Bacteroidota bacterium]|nr:hypothetical protein [Bacteroidota bacterium]